ncbi:SigE family RNA polymerase sigma factor [Planomonospora parontospora]|uniref:SigE family RNA polymerase sigma factor n=1 Tax=Planomonospora parontospora TaxID=58119 RepID=UPI00198B7F06|nr:SigE family RNA polymerase sigma factor [Planomonospora parontospora]GGL56396.1 DNA-directed RNA polymerase sigma-70 factor [Planomonospora parontospora subsp. antibiotica]GII19219.1 DNA-directed RNA polymerase sigma-70 factor [Planomonospora parontospora subsp. antibiotica]
MEFADFVAARGSALYRYGYVLTGNAEDAADLTQEALMRLGDAWSRVRRRDDPEGYVRTTMARLHISAWRRLRRERLVPQVPETAYTDGAVDDTGLWNELKGLPPKQRAVLVLRYYEDLPDQEIAALLGISRGTVRSQAARALEKLRVRAAALEPGRIG